MSDITIDQMIKWMEGVIMAGHDTEAVLPELRVPEPDWAVAAAIRQVLEQHRAEVVIVKAFVERVRRRYEETNEDDYSQYERCLDDELEVLEPRQKEDEYKTTTD